MKRIIFTAMALAFVSSVAYGATWETAGNLTTPVPANDTYFTTYTDSLSADGNGGAKKLYLNGDVNNTLRGDGTMGPVSTVNTVTVNAACDGVTDDTAAFTAATTAMTDGDVFLVPYTGLDCLVDGEINLEGLSNIILDIRNNITQTSTTETHTIVVGGSTGAYEKNIAIIGTGYPVIDGNGSNVVGYTYSETVNSYDTIRVNYTDGYLVRGMSIDNGLISGLKAQRSKNGVVRLNFFDGSVHNNCIAITRDSETYSYADRSTWSNSLISDNYVINAHDFGMASFDSSGNTFENNIVLASGNNNTDGWGSGGGMALERDVGDLTKLYHNTLRNNVVHDTIGKGLFITQHDISVDGMRIYNIDSATGDTAAFTGHGIYAINTKALSFKNLDISATDNNSIFTLGDTALGYTEVTISDSKFHGNTDGLLFQGAEYVNLSDIEIDQAGLAPGIFVNNAGSTYNEGNGTVLVSSISATGTTGAASVDINFVNDANVSNNNLYTQKGIRLQHITEASIIGNVTDDPNDDGTGLNVLATVDQTYTGNNSFKNNVPYVNNAVTKLGIEFLPAGLDNQLQFNDGNVLAGATGLDVISNGLLELSTGLRVRNNTPSLTFYESDSLYSPKLQSVAGSLVGQAIQVSDGTWLRTPLSFDMSALNGSWAFQSDGDFDINGGVLFGNTTDTVEGAVRWTGSDLEVYQSSAWVSLTSTGTGTGNVITDGSATSGLVTYWTGAYTAAYDVGFSYNSATDTLTVGSISANAIGVNLKGAYANLLYNDGVSLVSDDAYGSGWNGSFQAASQNAIWDKIETLSAAAPEGTAVLSTGETGGTKYLREDGDGTSSWQPVVGSSSGVTEGTAIPTTLSDGSFYHKTDDHTLYLGTPTGILGPSPAWGWTGQTYTLSLDIQDNLASDTITVNGTAYSTTGVNTIAGLSGSESLTIAYGGTNDTMTWTGTDAGDVVTDTANSLYHIVMDENKAITGTFSEAVVVCSSTAFFDTGETDNSLIAHYDNTSNYVGGLWVGATHTDVCRVDVNIKSIAGDVSAIDYEISVYALNGNDLTDYTSPVATSNTVSGSLFSADNYTSFSFPSSFSVSSPMAVVINRVDESYDASNRIAISQDTTNPGVFDAVWYGNTGTRTNTQGRAMAFKLYEVE